MDSSEPLSFQAPAQQLLLSVKKQVLEGCKSEAEAGCQVGLCLLFISY